MDNSGEQKPHIIIRRITEDDIEGVLAVDRGISGSDRALTYASAPNSYVGGELGVSVVAETDEQIVGFLLGHVADSPLGRFDTALLLLLGVDPGYRRQGIGTRMVHAFAECCQQKGVRTMRVMVSWHDWWLLSFLTSLGFARGEMAEFIKTL